VLAAQVLATPEALTVGVAVLGTLLAFEFAYSARGRGATGAYPRVLRCLVAGLAILTCWLVFLGTYGALKDWTFSFAATIPGHRLTGGLESFIPRTKFEVLAPVAAIVVAFAFVTILVWRRRSLSYGDWLMIAMAGSAALYYPKFLSRADSAHLNQAFAAAVPLLFYVSYRGITYAESLLAKIVGARIELLPRRHILTLPLLLVLLAAAPVPVYDAVRAAPGHFVAVAAEEPEIARVGYARKGENNADVLRGLEDAFTSLLAPGDTVFDFSNAPGVFYYLVEAPLATRYYHVSYAIRQRTQTDLVRRLRADPPAAVVFSSAGAGSQGFNSLPGWDGITNQVRHYDVSTYLLDNYVPIRDVGGFVVMGRKDRGAVADPDLYFRNGTCDWGYVPNYFAPEPSPTARSSRLPFRRLEPVGTRGRKEYAVALPPDAARFRWLEIRTGAPLADGDFLLADRRDLPPHAARAIFFKSLSRTNSRVIRVPVGACSQWRAYRRGTVYLSTTGPQDIREIRLVERASSVP
jgi:hypothetical protein